MNDPKTSLILMENPFVVPGGRFREMYYWDTYWTILGLIQSEMTQTVKGEHDLTPPRYKSIHLTGMIYSAKASPYI